MSRVASGPAANAAGSDGTTLATTKVITTRPPSISTSKARRPARKRSIGARYALAAYSV